MTEIASELLPFPNLPYGWKVVPYNNLSYYHDFFFMEEYIFTATLTDGGIRDAQVPEHSLYRASIHQLMSHFNSRIEQSRAAHCSEVEKQMAKSLKEWIRTT